MPPKLPPSDAMTLQELGVADLDCAFDPDGFLDSPPSDQIDRTTATDFMDSEDPVAVDDQPRRSLTSKPDRSMPCQKQ